MPGGLLGAWYDLNKPLLAAVGLTFLAMLHSAPVLGSPALTILWVPPSPFSFCSILWKAAKAERNLETGLLQLMFEHHGALVKCKFWFSRCGVGLQICISNKLPGDVHTASPQSTF